MSKFVIGLTLVLVLGITLCVSGCGAQRAKSANAKAAVNPAGAGQIQRFDFSEWFSYEPAVVKPNAPQYGLPLEKGRITDFEPVVSSLELGPEATKRLLDLGFVVTDLPRSSKYEDVVDAYNVVTRAGVPVIVTSGSLLHVFHVLFDDLLRRIESERLYDELWNLSLSLHNSNLKTYRQSDGDLAEAARRNAVFFAVGLTLLTHEEEETRRSGWPSALGETGETGYRFEVPAELAEEVGKEVELIAKHAGFFGSPLFIYDEDYSQYVPRGHYTYSEKLKKYFKAMMWYGRMTMLLKGSGTVDVGESSRTRDGLISEYDARIQTLEALMIASAMDSDQELLARWETMYRVTSFFVGFSDDLGPYEYIEAMKDVFGGEPDLGTFTAEHHGELKARLAEYHSPRIYGGTGNPIIFPPFTPEQADEILDVTRGFRLMGQRYVPDSHMLSQLVAPHTGEFTGGEMPFTAFPVPGVGIERVFPRGLDVMAVLGSERAREILDETGDADYSGYDRAFASIKQEIDAIQGPEWNQNLYWNWIWMLKAYVGEADAGYPAFMQSDAWRDRVITQALASWSELRHDTILYVKQSYTAMLTAINLPPQEPVGPPPGYVEPVIETYTRLLSLTRMMREGLTAMGVIGSQDVRTVTGLENVLERLISISTVELQGQPLGEEDLNYIHGFGGTLDDLFGGLEDKSRKTTLVADVHTDGNSGMVLEEAVGYVDLLVAAWKSPDGNIYVGGGPELSYYEFKQPMGNRLTDEAWRELLESDPPAPPSWTASYTTP
ncbi:MAG: DUF3160 domain-containing protein [Candidatus Eisenbacteria bacterium]